MNKFLLNDDLLEIAESLDEIIFAFSGKTVLLTGGRGFLGRYFSSFFEHINANVLTHPVKLIILDNYITAGALGRNVVDAENIEFIEHDVSLPFDWDGDIDFIIHAAGIASPFYYRAYPLETMQVAVNGTRNMLELAEKKNARFVFFSSSEIYGDPDSKHIPIAESYRGNVSCQGPRACYDESKRIGETLCYVFHGQYGTHTNTIRPFNVYGPGMQETDYRVLPNFASRLKAGEPLRVYGSGLQTRTFCYITDALEGFIRVILKGVPGDAYNIGTPEPEVSMVDLVNELIKVTGKDVPHYVVEYPDSYPADEPQRRVPDIRKAKLQLDFHPKVSLHDGLRRFLSWTDAVYTGKQ